jgi:hypothetical protein
MALSLKTDSIAVGEMGRRRIFVAQAAKGSGSTPMMLIRQVCWESPWTRRVAIPG